MGDFADDLSMDYDGEAYSEMSKSDKKDFHRGRSILSTRKSNEKEFRISIVDKNMNVAWSDTVFASSSKNAQTKFRDNFKDIRSKYMSLGGYKLKVSRV